MLSNEDRMTAWFAGRRVLDADVFPIGIGDDMAHMRTGADSGVLVSTDMLLDGSHFDSTLHSLEEIGYKAAAVSISDAAAMASVPVALVAAVGLPDGSGEESLRRLHAGLLKACDECGCGLVGGDITSWRAGGKLALCTTIMSRPGKTAPVRRSGAKQGDLICVTGELGGSLAGKHISFTPRVREALWIAENLAPTSMIDITDGLSSDLCRICEASGTGAVIKAGAIPFSAEAQAKSDPLHSALCDGEDFELLFTIPWQSAGLLGKADFKITPIGEIAAPGTMTIELGGSSTRELRPGGYDHLSRGHKL